MTGPQPIRLLLTGPVSGFDRWLWTLEGAEGLEVVARELLEIVANELPPPDRRPDWLCMTSANAAAGLGACWYELADVPAAVVGEQSAELLRAIGIEVAVGPAPSAAELLRQWRPRLRPGQRVFWPRGSVSDALADELRSLGLTVDAPVAYETRECTDRRALPPCDYMFLASPSAVRACMRLERVDPVAPVAVAIGPTTAAALEGVQALEPRPFARIEVLPDPTPDALLNLLVGLERRKLRDR